MSFIIALFAGVVFGLGLIVSGMTDPSKVKAFLDVFGAWDPSLALVMGSAIAVAIIPFQWVQRMRGAHQAWSGAPIELPQNNAIDRRLIMGGLLFGAGWGIAGLCPGPAVVVASSGSVYVLVFVLAMLVGMWGHDRLLTK